MKHHKTGDMLIKIWIYYERLCSRSSLLDSSEDYGPMEELNVAEDAKEVSK